MSEMDYLDRGQSARDAGDHGGAAFYESMAYKKAQEQNGYDARPFRSVTTSYSTDNWNNAFDSYFYILVLIGGIIMPYMLWDRLLIRDNALPFIGRTVATVTDSSLVATILVIILVTGSMALWYGHLRLIGTSNIYRWITAIIGVMVVIAAL